MAFKGIFEDAAPERSSYEAPDFKLSAGKQSVTGEPVSLSAWRVRASTQEIADAIAQLYGGVAVSEEHPDYPLSVETDAKTVKLIVSPGGLESDFKGWTNGQLTHHCDGFIFKSGDEDEIGQPCGCPTTLEDRQAKAKKFKAPKPSIQLRFRLADDPELGVGELSSSSWILAKALARGLGDQLETAREDVLISATLKEINGAKFDYTITELKFLGTWNAAIAG